MNQCDHSNSMNYTEGIIGTFNDETKIDNQWMFRRCQKCGYLESAKLGKWKKADKKSQNAYNSTHHLTIHGLSY